MVDDPVPYEELLPYFRDAKRDGDWLMRLCPAHPDGQKHNRPSLGLCRTGRQPGTLKCFAGCDFKAILEGLEREKPREHYRYTSTAIATAVRAPVRSSGPSPVAVYDYRNADGKLIAQKARFERDGQKRFQWRMPGVEGWPAKDEGGGLQEGTETPLWGAEQIAKHQPGSEWIVFCEGEKATQACRDQGFLAVCHGGGASVREFGGALDVLAGHKVALWPDNDEPGRRYMMNIASRLRLIAAETMLIVVPVPEKGDAYDYFKAGGKPEDVFTGEHKDPVVEFLATDHIRIAVPTETGQVSFDFDELEYGEKLEIWGELIVKPDKPGPGPTDYTTRINLLSPSAREVLVRALNRLFPVVNWTAAVNVAISRCREAYETQQRGALLPDGDVSSTEPPMAMGRLVPWKQPVVIFGDGESGKTTFLHAVMASFALGKPTLGLEVFDPGHVMLVDWENTEVEAQNTRNRILKGIGLDPKETKLPFHYWKANGIPLAGQVVPLRKYIRENEIKLVVLDSGGPAQGSSPSDDVATILFFNAIDKLDATVVIICHITKWEAHLGAADKPFGSAYWHNLARRTFFVASAQATPDEKFIALLPKKANKGRRSAPLSYRIAFTEEEFTGPIVITPVDIRDVPAFEVHLPATERVWRFLKTNGDAMFHEIMAGMSWRGEEASVRLLKVLRNGKAEGWFQCIDEAGKQQKWRAIGTGLGNKA